MSFVNLLNLVLVSIFSFRIFKKTYAGVAAKRVCLKNVKAVDHKWYMMTKVGLLMWRVQWP